MRRILLVWELGGEYGHIARFLPLALAFSEQGYEPVLLLRDLCRGESLLGSHGLTCLQAPLWIAEITGLPRAANYAETLMRFGYLDATGLLGVCKAWRNLVSLLNPSLIVFDHAPTAILATRGMPIPRAVLGDSFSLPPKLSPLPAYQWWAGVPAARLRDSEAKVLATANTVLDRFGQPPLTALHELFDAEARILCSTPPLDVYPQREPQARYWGNLVNLEQGATPVWPHGPSGKRVFAYLKPTDGRFEPTLQALNTLDTASLVHAPGVSSKIIATYTSPRLAFSREPLRMAEAARQADLIICHAGRTADVALAYGKPCLLLPMQTEQLMASKRVEQLGAALVIPPEPPPAQLKKALQRLLREAAFSERARLLAEANPETGQEDRLRSIIQHCLELMH